MKPQAGWDRLGATRARDDGKCFWGRAGDATLKFEEPLLHGDSLDTPGCDGALRNKNMYALDPDSANGFSIVAAIVIVISFVAMQALGWANFSNSVRLLLVSAAISTLVWWLFARKMTAKTANGSRTYVGVLGFQEFMNRVDADRLKTMPPDTFEKFLPYAMALGVEHHWAQAFAGIVKDPPSWYVASAPVHRIQSDFLFQFHEQHGYKHAAGLRFRPAG